MFSEILGQERKMSPFNVYVVNRLLRENRKTILKVFKNVTLQILNFIPVS